VQDDGVGFDLAKGCKASLGLASMRQRIALQGGKFKIDTQAGAGTVISAWVPLNAALVEADPRSV
jgi:signal transduction histidine kinase